MAMRVATFAMNERMLSASLRTQAKMAQMQIQQATGQVSTDYGGLGAIAGKVLDLEISTARSKLYGSAATEANARVQVMVDQVFSFGELGFQEVETSRYLTDALRKQGFTITTGTSGLPTAWVAR